MSTGFSFASCCKFRQVQSPGVRQNKLLLGDTFDRQPVLADGLDMLRPWVNQDHIEPVMREVTPGIAADRAGADHRDALAHDFLPL